jgi:hypothetical protein
MSLVYIGQDDFGVGLLRGVAPDVQPGVGLYNVVNGLFNDDGDVYRRGGDSFVDSGPFPSALTFLWTGTLKDGPASLLATANNSYSAFNPGVSYQIGPGVAAPVLPAIVNGKLYLPNLQSWTGSGNLVAWVRPVSLPGSGELHVCAAAGRLLVASGNRIAFSTAPPDAFAFNATDYHELPGGVTVVGMTAIRDTAFVFTDYGLWTIANLAFDLTDAQGNVQQQLQLITPEIALWHEAGICQWEGRIVAPCTDRVYLIDGVSPPQPVSDSIASLYTSFVRQGVRPGGAQVFNQHLFLPIIDNSLNSAQFLICRLSRPQRARYLYFPWSIVIGHPALVTMLAVSGRNDPIGSGLGDPALFAVGSDGRAVDMTGLLLPALAGPIDADFSTYEFEIETRDFPTGQGQPNHIRQIRMRYTLDSPEDTTNIDASLSFQPETTATPRAWTALGPQTLAEPGVDPAKWPLLGAKRARYARMRFHTANGPQQLIVHHVDMAIRPAAHQR